MPAGPLARRDVLGMMAAAAVTRPAGARPRYDAVVDPARGDTLKGALERAGAANGKPFRILLKRGALREKVTIAVPNVTLEGEGPESILHYDDASRTLDASGKPTGTRGSAALTIAARGVTLRNLTIRNSFDYLGARARGETDTQSVALLIAREASAVAVERCGIESYHDTLYVQGVASFDTCRIAGRTDFIFGGGAAWFAGCEIVTRHVPGSSDNIIAAPSTLATQPFGLVFARCRLSREPGVGDDTTWLGRPWRQGGNLRRLGQAAFLDCWMDRHVRRAGWTRMHFPGPDGAERWTTPEEARLFEYRSRGPGAGAPQSSRRVLDSAAARAFRRDRVLSVAVSD